MLQWLRNQKHFQAEAHNHTLYHTELPRSSSMWLQEKNIRVVSHQAGVATCEQDWSLWDDANRPPQPVEIHGADVHPVDVDLACKWHVRRSLCRKPCPKGEKEVKNSTT